MPNYKLTYFDLRGRGEIARLIFAAAGQKFEDNRIGFDKWPEVKKTTPFGQIPMLEVDSVVLCQSITIARFLANKFGLAGKTSIEKAQADMIVDCLTDLVTPCAELRLEKDDTKKAELIAKLSKEFLPNQIANLEKLLRSNRGGDTYFVGDSLTWADLQYINSITLLSTLGIELDLSKAPKLKALKGRVERNTRIEEYLKKRPQTDF